MPARAAEIRDRPKDVEIASRGRKKFVVGAGLSRVRRARESAAVSPGLGRPARKRMGMKIHGYLVRAGFEAQP